MTNESVFIDFDPNDFIIRLSPFLDEKGDWTGELMIGTITTEDNTTSDNDYQNITDLCQMICASIPAMEEDSNIRETLYKYANSMVQKDEDKPKVTVEELQDNVVKLKFN